MFDYKKAWKLHRSQVIVMIVIGGGLLIGLVYLGLSRTIFNSKATDSATTQPPANRAVTDPANQAAPKAETTITITADGFSPTTLQVAQGTTVTWKNGDTKDHAVDPQTTGHGPHSPRLAAGESFNYSFQETGTFDYKDTLNPDHKAAIIVKTTK
jgi:plastocyanin